MGTDDRDFLDDDALRSFRDRWTAMLDVLARAVAVPAALVMRVHQDDGEIEVFAASPTEGNVYEPGERAPLDTGLYCETVMADRAMLLVPDALADPDWADNPDVDLGMISYLGLPVAWPSGEMFGTICVLDTGRHDHPELDQHLLEQFRALVEHDLAALEREQRLRRNQADLAAAQRIAHVGNWTWDIGSGAIAWTDEVFRIFGHAPGAFDPTFDRLLASTHPEDRQAVAGAVDAALAGDGRYWIEHRIVRPDGEQRIVQEAGEIARGADGRPTSMIGTVQDVTARRTAELDALAAHERAEAALRDALAAEQELARRSREIDDLKSRFLAAVSHELRTPVSVVDGFAEMLKTRWHVLPPDIAEIAVDRMQANARRLSELVSSLLHLDRLTHGGETLRPETADVAGRVRAAVERLRASTHDVSIDVDAVPGRFDGEKVEQIVEVLVGNAIAHTPMDTHVEVTLERQRDGSALLTVADSGPGVPDDLKETVFEPFVLGDTDRAASRGIGISLTLVSQYAKLHAGRAWVEDGPDGGATFRVLLRPIPDEEDGPASAATVPSPNAT